MGVRQGGGLAQGSGGVKKQRSEGSVGNGECGVWSEPALWVGVGGAAHLEPCKASPFGEWEWRKEVLPWLNSFHAYPLLGLIGHLGFSLM